MDIALSSLIIFLIILPGLLYNKIFYGELQFLTDSDRGWGALILSSLLPGLVIQSIGVLFIYAFPSLCLRFDILGYLISGCNTDAITLETFTCCQNSYLKIFSYFVIVCFLSILAGKLFRNIVLKYYWDVKYRSVFKFNKWYYYLTGRIEEGTDLIKADILVNTEDGTSLYSGFLSDYTLNGNSIETIYLRKAIRWIKAEKPADRKFRAVPGDYLVIPGKEILNMNLTYFQIKEKEKTVEKNPGVNKPGGKKRSDEKGAE